MHLTTSMGSIEETLKICDCPYKTEAIKVFNGLAQHLLGWQPSSIAVRQLFIPWLTSACMNEAGNLVGDFDLSSEAVRVTSTGWGLSPGCLTVYPHQLQISWQRVLIECLLVLESVDWMCNMPTNPAQVPYFGSLVNAEGSNSRE